MGGERWGGEMREERGEKRDERREERGERREEKRDEMRRGRGGEGITTCTLSRVVSMVLL
tara:strand:+ start:1032 stop:1211 length:180 start_codon:yes stop_codon:yes gene_type:complete